MNKLTGLILNKAVHVRCSQRLSLLFFVLNIILTYPVLKLGFGLMTGRSDPFWTILCLIAYFLTFILAKLFQ